MVRSIAANDVSSGSIPPPVFLSLKKNLFVIYTYIAIGGSMKSDKKVAAVCLRKSGMSVREISKELSVSKSSVSLWVRDIELTEEQCVILKENQCSSFEKMRASKLSYADKCRANRVEWQLEGRNRIGDIDFVAGCMLYWGEGGKTSPSTVVMTNSDPEILIYFKNFLLEQFEVSPESLKSCINVHLDYGLLYEDVKSYWSNLLGIPECNFYKPQLHVGEKRTKGKHKRLQYGTVQIKLFNVRIAQTIFGGIQGHAGINKEEWLG